MREREVLDLAGGDTPLCTLPTPRDGGLLVSVTSGSDHANDAAGGRVRVVYILVEPDRANLEVIAGLVETSRLRVCIGRTIPLAEVRQAHQLSETGRVAGKLLLTVGDA